MPKRKRPEAGATPFSAEGLTWLTEGEAVLAVITLWVASNKIRFGNWLRLWAELLGISMEEIATALADKALIPEASRVSWLSNAMNGKDGFVVTLPMMQTIFEMLEVKPHWALMKMDILDVPEGMQAPEGPYSAKLMALLEELQDDGVRQSFGRYLRDELHIVREDAEQVALRLNTFGVWRGQTDKTSLHGLITRITTGRMTLSAPMLVVLGTYRQLNNGRLADDFHRWRTRGEIST